MSSTSCGRRKVASVSGMTGDDPRSTGHPADHPADHPVDLVGTGTVDVRRSARRRRTVSAYRDGDRTVVLIPARMSRAEEREWVAVMLERLARQDARLRPR